MLTGKELEEYTSDAIKEVCRINSIRPNFTYFDYNEIARYPYKGQQIRDATGLKLNDIKSLPD